MGMFEFIIAIVLIGTISSVVTGGMRLERHRMKLRASESEAGELKGLIGDMHSEITKLKDRVRVLERLVTDDDRRLADEIERLRRQETSPGA
jgi:predicted  nucleic acid-binding Zn-ribbon protein